MTPTQPKITATTHPLPFHQLSPCDFERLCLIQREGYERPKHLAAAGSERAADGESRDLIAWRGNRFWAFQTRSAKYSGESLTRVAYVKGTAGSTKRRRVFFERTHYGRSFHLH